MADLIVTPDQIAKAREAGYSDDEIVGYLAPKRPEQFKAAKDAGYSASEILAHFGAAKPAAEPEAEPSIMQDIASGVKHGVHEMVRGTQSSRKNILGSDVDDTPVDPDYKPANVTNGSWNPLKWSPRQIPKLIAEQAPLAATSAVGAAAGDLLGPAGAIIGGVAPLAITQAGDNVKARTVARTGDQNATPSDEDKAIGIGTTLAAAVPGSIMHAPGLGNAVGSGLNGVGRVVTNLLTRAGIGAGGNVAANAVTQAGTKIGTDQTFDPSQLPEAAVGGFANVTPHLVPSVAAANRSLRMGKFNSDTEAAANVATRLQNTDLDLNNIRQAAQAHGKVKADIHNELKGALSNVEKVKPLSPDEANTIAAFKRGDKITPKDMETLQSAVANTPDGDNAHFLARALKTAQRLEGEGSFHPENGWQGTLTGGMKNVVRGVFNPWHIGGTMAGLGAAAFGFPHVSGAVGGGLLGGLTAGFAGARLLDSVTGGSRPAANFAKTFADHNAQLRKATTPPPQQPPPIPQAPNTPWGPRPPMSGPTGPQVPPPGVPAQAPNFNPFALQMLKKQLAKPLPGTEPAAAPEVAKPDISPMALQMLKQKLKQGLPAEPTPAPEAPPPKPDISPMALKMMQQKLKQGLPPEPQAAPEAPPAPPAKPDISPMALQMLRQKLKAGLPPEPTPAPEAPPAPPAKPDISPVALAMMRQKLKAGLPPEAPPAAPAAPTASPVTPARPVLNSMADVLRASEARAAEKAGPVKIKKSKGKVKAEEAEAPKKAPEESAFEPLDEEKLYPKGISAKAYAMQEASAYGAMRSPKYLLKAEQSAQKRINAETALVKQFPEWKHAIHALVRQLHKVGANPKARDGAVDYYTNFISSPEAKAAVEAAFK